jgi:hypothetical protein
MDPAAPAKPPKPVSLTRFLIEQQRGKRRRVQAFLGLKNAIERVTDCHRETVVS